MGMKFVPTGFKEAERELSDEGMDVVMCRLLKKTAFGMLAEAETDSRIQGCITTAHAH